MATAHAAPTRQPSFQHDVVASMFKMSDPKRPRLSGYNEWLRDAILARIPIAQLAVKFDPKKTLGSPELHFGFALTQQQLLEYAVSHDLVCDMYPDDPLDIYSCQVPALHRLRKVSGVETVYIADPFQGPSPGSVMAALYSNYTTRKEELNLEGCALWYWDAGNDRSPSIVSAGPMESVSSLLVAYSTLNYSLIVLDL
ncbi:hypothetical protein BV25DRAFT_1919241 [Artomyces pyxidatus]|uniref:Uncharacterized protein n=1 Tax=Artomyces pyxidatus TaxID=48021 RepID=A0ACB8SPX4_9AGAM|nr:hypothetical protein BV25DRAFT_1919241 [Artomyces pyxidatus]